MSRILLITLILSIQLLANVKLINHTKTLTNAQTALLELVGKNITNAKLTLENYNLDFYKNEFKENSHIAFIPISYYEKLGKKRVIISYYQDGNKHFKATSFKVIDGKYKSETLNVQPSKIKLNDEDKKRVNLEYQEAMLIYKTKTTAKLWNEDFIMPMNSPITSDFGTKRVYNGELRSYHSGIDFKADIGTPIYASNDGIVKIAKDRFYAGNSVIINHGLGIYTCYFHLDKIVVKKNQKVKRGELLGYSGSTGRVTGPHLHFATKVDGTTVEPRNLITLLNSLKD